ncbi:hypothetical protein MTR_2g036280 [Medicago truncatula]|uniref:Uncharacterized protein n=1 Tax=Medicago truncatula TaxID=3880 RepID=G7IG45_MEDTR|nr:hypothetical protein MTR_2g036280 [Medicago truncatula]
MQFIMLKFPCEDVREEKYELKNSEPCLLRMGDEKGRRWVLTRVLVIMLEGADEGEA